VLRNKLLLHGSDSEVRVFHNRSAHLALNLQLAIYPRTYDPSFSTGMCILAVVFASTFALIFPLIGPAVVILLFLTLVGEYYLFGLSHRYLQG